jgi:hypothetical protein
MCHACIVRVHCGVYCSQYKKGIGGYILYEVLCTTTTETDVVYRVLLGNIYDRSLVSSSTENLI